jgi:hypothetical protein
MSRNTVLVIVAFALAATEAAAQAGPAYVPGAHRYRVTRESKQAQEVMGETQNVSITMIEEVSLQLTPAGRDTLAFSFVLDSVSRQTDTPDAAPEAPQKGATFGGRLSPRGSVHAFNVDPSMATAAQGYRSFFLRLPAAELKVGTAWTDTVTIALAQNGIDGSGTTVTQSRVVGDTTIGGQKAWRIDRSAVLTMSGVGNQGGTELTMKGSGTARGTAYLTSAGLYLGATSEQQLDLTVEVPAASLTIPIRQMTTTRVERIGDGPKR